MPDNDASQGSPERVKSTGLGYVEYQPHRRCAPIRHYLTPPSRTATNLQHAYTQRR